MICYSAFSGFWRRHKFIFMLAVFFALPGGYASAARLFDMSGKVEIRRAGAQDWLRVETQLIVHPGDSVKTGWRSRVQIEFDDGSRVELGSSSSYVLEKDGAGRTDTGMKLNFGWMKAWVQKLAKRKFDVRTPTAVCSVRGTEFAVNVEGNKTSVDLFRGLIAVGDVKGNESVLREGQHVTVDEKGLGRVMSSGEFKTQQKEESQQVLKHEVALNMTKEQVQAAASEEIKLAEYQQGKSMIDVFGNRVRLEQYIMRPRADQFKLVVLNDRRDRFDYFYYLGTFNTTLPTDLSVALKQLSGCSGAMCAYNLTGYETGRSNLTDTVQENASGGHQVDLNSNSDPSDDITSYFDSELNKYVSVSGGFYKTLFDNYWIKYNGTKFLEWSPKSGSLDNYSTTLANGVNYYYIGDNELLGSANAGVPTTNSDRSPDGSLLHDKIRLTYGTGTYWEQYDNYIVSDEGNVATLSDFSGVRDGVTYKETLLKWNFEQVVTSSLFGGRKIDLVIEPKTLIQSGLIK